MWIFWPNPESLPVCRIVIIRMHIGLKRTTRIKLEIELIHFLKSLYSLNAHAHLQNRTTRTRDIGSSKTIVFPRCGSGVKIQVSAPLQSRGVLPIHMCARFGVHHNDVEPCKILGNLNW